MHSLSASVRPIAAMFIASSLVAGSIASAEGAKNVIILIADGAGFNTLDSTRYWQGAPLVHDGVEWQSYPLATYALRKSPTVPVEGPEGLAQDPAIVYSPMLAWDTTPVDGGASGFPFYFAGYKWNRDTDPDSANTMSAMMTGARTYNNAINVDGNGMPLLTLPEIAKAHGKSVGSLSSVPFTHATVACGAGAHNINRNNYHELAQEIFAAGVVDVIGGGGHPWYDSVGNLRPAPDYTWVDAATWDALAAGTLDSNDGAMWTLVDSTTAIQDLMTGPVPAKLALFPPTGDTLQQSRPSAGDPALTAPGDDPFTPGMPSLETLTKVALNALGTNPEGFFLHVEGGAVDWAMHANQFGRMIEEHMEFQKSVQAVIDYLDAGTNGNTWENTIVVITADHDHMLFGPESDVIPFQSVQDNGAGVLPGYLWHDNSHSNQIVPMFARGIGAELFADVADEIDTYDDGEFVLGHGAYLHQAELGLLLIDLISTCPADLNGDGAVDGVDLGVLLNAWSAVPGAPGCNGAAQCFADLDRDGVVSAADLGLMLGSWGTCGE